MPGPLLPPVEFLKSPAAEAHSWSVADSLAYSRWLATHHYENFHVASYLLPKRLHQDFYNVYTFCRWADDLGDEIGDAGESLRLLSWWRGELKAMYAGSATHPVFIGLRETAGRHGLPIALFDDLIKAFEQDQVVTRYETWAEVFEYCRYSANPVGRLLLHLCGYTDPELLRLSDATCTALQLANHWQDVAVDLAKGRVYIPLEAMRVHGYTVEQLAAREFNEAFRGVMSDACKVAHERFVEGLPLADRVDRRLAIDLELFSRGGMKVLDKIARQDYNVLARRPAISKIERAGLFLGAVLRRGLGRKAA
jgi:squalene synthase HpnC